MEYPEPGVTYQPCGDGVKPVDFKIEKLQDQNKWSPRRDLFRIGEIPTRSNSRPHPYQGCDLTS
jgi:hypothetical protein